MAAGSKMNFVLKVRQKLTIWCYNLGKNGMPVHLGYFQNYIKLTKDQIFKKFISSNIDLILMLTRRIG